MTKTDNEVAPLIRHQVTQAPRSCFSNFFYIFCFLCLLVIAFIFLNFEDSLYAKSKAMSARSAAPVVQNVTTPSLPGANVPIRIDDRVLQHFRENAYVRKTRLRSSFREFYNLLVPEVSCPNLMRIGYVGDGGKWACNPLRILEWQRPCTVYSLGLQNAITFDQEFQKLTNYKCNHVAVDMSRQYDYTVRELEAIGSQVRAVTMGPKSFTNGTVHIATMIDLMRDLNDTHIDVLKMDIEETEMEMVGELASLSICQILIELHALGKNETYSVLYNFLHEMGRAGFHLVHYEINMNTMRAVEVVLLHEKCFEDFGPVVKLARILDK